MRKMLRNTTFALGLLGSAALLAGPSFAVEPDVETPAWPELLAPHADLPDFQLDWACCDDAPDQTIVEISPEGKLVIVEPDIVTGPPPVVDRSPPSPEMEDLTPTR